MVYWPELVFDIPAGWKLSGELRAENWKVAVMPCPHVTDETRCMMIVKPQGKRGLSPQQGEAWGSTGNQTDSAQPSASV